MHWFKPSLLILIASPAWAVESYVIGGGVEADTADGIAAAVLADVQISEKTFVYGSLARNSVDLPRDISLNTTYGDIGVDHHFDPVGIRLGAAYWGDNDILDSIDARASLYFDNDQFMLSADIEYRDFEFDIPPTDFLPGRDVRFHANGLGASGRVRINDVVSLNFQGISYDYNVPLSLDANRGILELLSVSRLSLINSLIDYRVGGGIGLDFGDRRWNIDYRNWEGAVDGSRTDSTTLRFLTPIGERTDIEFGLGVDDNDRFGSVTFFSVFVYFYGGS